MKRTHFQLAILAGLAATFALLPQAKAELVYEDGVTQTPTNQAARVDDRALTRQTLGSSEKAQVTLQQQPVQQQVVQQQPIQQQVIQQPVAAQVQVGAPALVQDAAPADEVQNYSKSELIRRTRLREEMKNEDVLQERLEELRLRDEQRRTQQILGGAQGPSGDVSLPAPIYGAAAGAGANGATGAVSAQAVTAPVVTERVGQAAVAPVAETKVVSTPSGATVAMADIGQAGGASMAYSVSSSESADKSTFTVSPRAGISNVANQGGFDVSGHFSAGVGLGVSLSDNFAIEAGYTYSEYGVGSNYFSGDAAMLLKQNIIDAVGKLYLVGPDSKLRPFAMAGIGYSLGYLNYNQNSSYGSYFNGNDYSMNSVLGELGAGLDLKVAKNISITAGFKYYKTMSSSENNNFSYDYDGTKQYVGDTLRNANYYSVLGGVNFTF